MRKLMWVKYFAALISYILRHRENVFNVYVHLFMIFSTFTSTRTASGPIQRTQENGMTYSISRPKKQNSFPGPENKQRWIIDEEATAVVRRIFRMVNDGKGVYQIADILSEEKVLCPSAYLAAKGVGNRRNSKFEDPYRWWGTTVSYILARVEYMGHTVNFKT